MCKPSCSWDQNILGKLGQYTGATDALAPYAARASAAMELTMQDKWVLVFQQEGFQENVPLQLWEIIESLTMILIA